MPVLRAAFKSGISYSMKSILNFHTFALGFRVDFSEDSEPSEELGDRLGPEYVATPATQSEPDDILVSNLPREFKGFVSQFALPVSEPLVNSPSDPVLSSTFAEI